MSDTTTVDAPTETTTPTGNSPVFDLRIGKFEAAVFEDERSTKDGRTFTGHSIKIRKSWKTGDGYDERTMYVDPQEVKQLQTVLEQAYLACYDKE